MVEKCKVLKDQENRLPNKDVAAKYGVQQKQCFKMGEKQTQINSFLGKKGNELLTKK